MSRFSPQSLGQLHGELRKIDWQEETKVGLGPTLDVKLTEQSASTRVYACLAVAKAHLMLQSAAGTTKIASLSRQHRAFSPGSK